MIRRLALLPLLLLPACTMIDAAGLISPEGEVINRKGNFDVSHRSIDRPTLDGGVRSYEEYTIEFDQNISKSIINVNAVSKDVDWGGHVVELATTEGPEAKKYLVILDDGQALSFTVIHESPYEAVLYIGPPA